MKQRSDCWRCGVGACEESAVVRRVDGGTRRDLLLTKAVVRDRVLIGMVDGVALYVHNHQV